MASTDTTAKARQLRARFPHLKHTQALRLVHEGRTRGQEVAGWDLEANAPIWADGPIITMDPMGPWPPSTPASWRPVPLSELAAQKDIDPLETGLPSITELGNVAVCGTVGVGATVLLRHLAASAVTEGWDVVYVTAHPWEADAIPKGATPVFVDPWPVEGPWGIDIPGPGTLDHPRLVVLDDLQDYLPLDPERRSWGAPHPWGAPESLAEEARWRARSDATARIRALLADSCTFVMARLVTPEAPGVAPLFEPYLSSVLALRHDSPESIDATKHLAPAGTVAPWDTLQVLPRGMALFAAPGAVCQVRIPAP